MKYLSLLFLSVFLISCNSGDASYANWSEPAKASFGPVAKGKADGKVPPFTGINLSASMDVVLTPGSSQSVRMEGPQELIDKVTTDVNKGVWDIGFDGKVNSREKLIIYITTPGLDLISISGSGDITTTGKFSGQNQVKIRISGSGDLEYMTDAQDVECGISGSGDIELSGSTNAFNASISGSGDMDAFAFSTKSAKVKIVGSGGMKIDVQNDLDISIVGSGDVHYKGNPTVRKSIIGSGDVIQK